jgi:oligoribonuclease NrnB/cAMP/cGMP phosphodiesterase (DHH superfamily)
MCKQATGVTLLDHHRTAEQDLAGFADECERHGLPRPTVVFDMTKSGGRLTWDYLTARFPDRSHPIGRWHYLLGGKPPWLVDLTEDRDLWAWKLPHSREVNAAVRTYPMTFADWDTLSVMGGSEAGLSALVTEGRAVLRAERKVVESHVRHAREIELAGHKVLCVNATTLTSEIAGELAASRPFGMCWFQRADGKYVYSFRSTPVGVDVSEIARSLGGGGHRNAAGCELPAPLPVWPSGGVS